MGEAADMAETGGWPPCPAPFNLAEHVLQAGLAPDDKIALVIAGMTGAERWSYGRLRAAVRGVAGDLAARGLQPGQRIGIRIGHSPRFPLLYLGAIAAGMVPVISPAGWTAREATAALAELDLALIVADEGLALPDLPGVPVVASGALQGAEDRSPAPYHRGAPERLAYILFTSGTSGRAMAVGHAHRAIWARGMMRQGWHDLRPTDRLLHGGAMHWSFTLGCGMMDPWTAGATALVPAPGVTPAQLPHLARRLDASILAGAPGLFRQMMKAPLPTLPKLRHGLTAGESLPHGLRLAWRDATGTDLHEAFGMSECSTYISGSPSRPAPQGAMGFAQPGRRVALLDAEGHELTGAAEGEIAIARDEPGLMLGYLGAAGCPALPAGESWFRTGDRAFRDHTGAFFPRGRADDQMNAGGLRVSPLEVEAWLSTFAGVDEIAVAEVEVKPGVRVIGCFYVAESALDAQEFAAHAARGLADWKCPRLYRRVAALPRKSNAKLDRRALAALTEVTE